MERKTASQSFAGKEKKIKKSAIFLKLKNFRAMIHSHAPADMP
jgi:hypothetical protein